MPTLRGEELSCIMGQPINFKMKQRAMKTSIVLTVIADDQPGVIENVSKTLKKYNGNWTQSSMSSLAGQFAGILLAHVPNDNTDACLAELHGLESEGLRVIAHVSDEQSKIGKTHEYTLDLIGNDRPGIIHEITELLANHHVNVRNLETLVEGASMGGGDLFKATAQLVIPDTTDLGELESALEDVANDLMVDINFDK